MAFYITLSERRVIPNWRDFKRTIILGELSQLRTQPAQKLDISNQITDWKLEQNIGIAADLVGSAFLARRTAEVEAKEAAEFILHNKGQSSLSLTSIATKVLAGENALVLNNEWGTETMLNRQASHLEELQGFGNNLIVYQKIRTIKHDLKSRLRDAIGWVELSRLYSFLGQEESATSAMSVALSLDGNNRHVLRSATRLFIHFGEYDQALFYLRRSSITKKDPWLISAHIASSSMAGKYQTLAKAGGELIASQAYTAFDFTELASSLGTLEFINDDYKKAKKLFNQSLKSPNDNSLAQIEWVSTEDTRYKIDVSAFNRVVHPYEALALKHSENGNWEEVLKNCINWFLDTPYSSRPVALGTFVASLFLEDYSIAITLGKAGLISNPQEPIILNNILYCLCLSNRLDEAIKYYHLLTRLRPSELDELSIVTLQATFGLYFFRTNNTERGKSYYDLAIRNADTRTEKDILLLVLANYLRELITHNCSEKHEVAQRLKSIKSDSFMKQYKDAKTKALNMYQEVLLPL